MPLETEEGTAEDSSRLGLLGVLKKPKRQKPARDPLSVGALAEKAKERSLGAGTLMNTSISTPGVLPERKRNGS